MPRKPGASGGTIYCMSHKTTIYLPDELKRAVETAALIKGSSEAEVIREAIAASVLRRRPRPGLLSAEPIAEQDERELAGFGER